MLCKPEVKPLSITVEVPTVSQSIAEPDVHQPNSELERRKSLIVLGLMSELINENIVASSIGRVCSAKA